MNHEPNLTLHMLLEAARVKTSSIFSVRASRDVVDGLLEINTNNRRPTPGHINALADAMRHGEYVSQNGQTIVINASGTWLLDGQHRLTALKEAGYPPYVFDIKVVADDEAKKVFSTIDTAERSRTVGYVLAALETDETQRSFVMKSAAVINFFFEMFENRTKVPAETVARHIECNHDLLQKVGVSGKKTKGVDAASFLGGCFAACRRNRNKEEEILGYIADVRNNTVNGKEYPVLSALRSLIETNASHFRANRREIFIKTVKALENPKLQTLRVGQLETVAKFKCAF